MKTKAILLAAILILLPFGVELVAQCPMCKIAAESNLENGGSAARGLNNGILYILSLPYIIIFTIGFIWYKNRKSPIEMDPQLN